MKKVRKKREINLGLNEETKHLVSRYRILKALEHSACKFAPNLDEIVNEELGDNYEEAKDLFVKYAYDVHANNLLADEGYLRSNELGILASLYRILETNDLLEEAVAEVTCWELGNNKIEDYSSHLKYYISHPEVHKEYKLHSN